MTFLRRQRRHWPALAAAFALVFHTLVAGVVGGAMASPQLLDPFGGIICTSHGGEKAPAAPGEPANHSHLPECCLAGCSVLGGLAIASPPPPLPQLFAGLVELVPAVDVAVLRHAERSPLNPRAPPLVV